MYSLQSEDGYATDIFDFVPQKKNQTEFLNRLIIDEMYSSHCQCDLHF